MRSLFISFAFLSLLCPVMTARALAADEQPIKDRIQEFQTAWNKDDTVAMAAVWASDGTEVTRFWLARGSLEFITFDAIKRRLHSH